MVGGVGDVGSNGYVLGGGDFADGAGGITEGDGGNIDGIIYGGDVVGDGVPTKGGVTGYHLYY